MKILTIKFIVLDDTDAELTARAVKRDAEAEGLTVYGVSGTREMTKEEEKAADELGLL